MEALAKRRIRLPRLSAPPAFREWWYLAVVLGALLALLLLSLEGRRAIVGPEILVQKLSPAPAVASPFPAAAP